jgi:hypothetical protein
VSFGQEAKNKKARKRLTLPKYNYIPSLILDKSDNSSSVSRLVFLFPAAIGKLEKKNTQTVATRFRESGESGMKTTENAALFDSTVFSALVDCCTSPVSANIESRTVSTSTMLTDYETEFVGLDVLLTCIDASVDSKSLHCVIRMCS